MILWRFIQVCGLTEDFSNNIVVFMETLMVIATLIGSFAQCTTMYAFNENWMRELDNRIADDWNVTKDPKELAILRRFLRQGKIMTFVYNGKSIKSIGKLLKPRKKFYCLFVGQEQLLQHTRGL